MTHLKMCAYIFFVFFVRCFHLVTSIHVQFRLSFRSIYSALGSYSSRTNRLSWLNDFHGFLSIFTAFDSKNTLRVQPDEIINRVIKINGTHSSTNHETKHFQKQCSIFTFILGFRYIHTLEFGITNLAFQIRSVLWLLTIFYRFM